MSIRWNMRRCARKSRHDRAFALVAPGDRFSVYRRLVRKPMPRSGRRWLVLEMVRHGTEVGHILRTLVSLSSDGSTISRHCRVFLSLAGLNRDDTVVRLARLDSLT